MTDLDYFEQLEFGTIQQKAVSLIVNSVFEAPHHRQWYIDQSVRVLTGSGYAEFVKRFESYFTEKWDTGIAP